MKNQEIDHYVKSLVYDYRELLSSADINHPKALPGLTKTDKSVIICTNTEKKISTEFKEVSILSPANGVIFPGALLLANRDLAEGKPQAITLSRAPLTLRVDLPNYKGVQVVENPKNSSVESAIDNLISDWKKTVGATGQDISARMSKEIKKAHSTSQLSTDLGFNVKWASNEIKNHLNYEKKSSESTVVAFFKQIYYTVTIDLPNEPSSVFTDDVKVEDVQRATNAQNPPAYVKSVDYGRIILMRMDTKSSSSKLDLENTLKMITSGGTEFDTSSKNKYKQIADNSSVTVLVLGGGAEVAADIFSPDGFNEIPKIIKNGIKFTEKNPAYPISYTVNFLKDHQFAAMPISTDYIETECVEHPAGFIRMINGSGCITNFQVKWKETNDQGNLVEKSFNSGDKNNGYDHKLYLPGDATQVRILGKAAVFIKTWKEIINEVEYGPTNKTYAIRGSIGKLKKDIS